MSISFIEKNPDQKVRLGGFYVRPEEYCGTIQIGGFEFHDWKCSLVSKADESELGVRHFTTATSGANAIAPDELQVDPETGFLDESINKLQRVNAKGEQNNIVRVGAGLSYPEGYGVKAGDMFKAE